MKPLSSRFVKRLRDSVKGSLAFSSQRLFAEKSFRVTGVPNGLISLDEQVQIVHQAEPIFYHSPKTQQEYWDHRFPKETTVGGAISEGLLKVDRGIATTLGGNLTSNGQLITTFLPSMDGKSPEEHSLFYFSLSRLRPSILSIQEPVASLTDGWQGAFYHWMYQVLPRLGLLKTPFPRLYIDQSHSFQRQSLALMGLSEGVIDASKYEAIQATELIIPQSPAIPTARSCQFLRENFLTDLSPSPKHRVYLSRGDAKTRRVLNEVEIFPILERFGFEKVVLSHRPFTEQIAIMHAAEMVVAPHGAGLAHLAFCDATTPVLEIFHPNYFNPCYWHICAARQMPYYVLFDTKESAAQDPDLLVDPKLLRKTLEAMEHDWAHR